MMILKLLISSFTADAIPKQTVYEPNGFNPQFGKFSVSWKY